MPKPHLYVLIILLSMINGCGTYVSRQIDYYTYYFGPLRTPIYSGVKWDVENQGEAHSKPVSNLIFIDIPLSFVADCLVLPYTVYEAFRYSDLPEAAVTGNIRRIEMLLSQGASIDETDWQGHTALMGAVIGKQVETVNLLLGKGASVNKRSFFNLTALGYTRGSGEFSEQTPAEKEVRREHFELIQGLLI
ncbi:MAG: ankyrin repeat domain-containing protein [Nitrospira sp.]